MAPRCVNLAQPWFTGMPHGRHHDVPSFEPRPHTVTFPGGSARVSITEIHTAAHVGTHIDAARHFFPDGPSIDAYPTARFVGPGIVLDAAREGPVPLTACELRAMHPEIRRGDIVFIYFGYAERFGRDDYRIHPYLSVDAAEFLIERGVNIVGTDTITPDAQGVTRQSGFDWPIHRRLLSRDVLIVENLGPGLRDVRGRRLTLAALPMQIRGGDGSPVAACALFEDG